MEKGNVYYFRQYFFYISVDFLKEERPEFVSAYLVLFENKHDYLLAKIILKHKDWNI